MLAELRAKSWRTRKVEVRHVEDFLDRFDAAAVHWIAWQGSVPIAAARMSVHQALSSVPDAERFTCFAEDEFLLPIASFNRLVVLPAARNCGLPREFDQLRLAEARSLGCQTAIGATTAGAKRIAGMESVGFTIVGAGQASSDLSFLAGIVPTVLACKLG